MWQLISGGYLGWALGANDASNVFGTAVASRMLRFWVAATLCSIFVFIGAVAEGGAGMETYKALSSTTLNTAFIVGLTAALTVTFMTWKRLPVSTSQAVVGSLTAVGILESHVELGVLGKVVACWIGTPIGAALITLLLYPVLAATINRLNLNMFQYDSLMRWALIISGSYGAYALGANNVANVTGAFVGPDMLSVRAATIIGGASIVLGIVTFSRGVMMTVGRGLVKLDAFSAFIAILAEGITVHIYAMIGVPVSTSQAVVGAVVGIGLIKGVKAVNRSVLINIVVAWVSTPLISGVATLGVIYGLRVAGVL